MRKNLILWMGVVMLLLVGCSSDDDANFGSGDSDVIANSPTALSNANDGYSLFILFPMLCKNN